MEEDISWFELAEKFEAADPWGILELYWLFKQATNEYLYTVRFAKESSFPAAAGPKTANPAVIKDKFLALCARARRKFGSDPPTAESWLAHASLGHEVAAFSGKIDDIKAGKQMEVMSGTVANIAHKGAQLCYRLDASPFIHGVLPASAQPNVDPMSEFPNRARWLADRLRERGWDHNMPEKFNGPDHKTVQKVLAAEKTIPNVLRKIVVALNSHHTAKKVTLDEIPND
jgi:hypothetical protein